MTEGLINIFDLILLIVIIISSFISFNKGFTREVLNIAAWFLTAIAIKYTYPITEPFIESLLGKGSVFTTGVNYFINFIVLIFILSYIVKKIGKGIHATDFKSIDKTLGILFGIARGIFIMAIIYLGILWLKPEAEQRPEWIKNSRSKPMLSICIKSIVKLFPETEAFQQIYKISNSEYESDEKLFETFSKPKIRNENKSKNFKGYSSSESDDLERHLNQIEEIERVQEEFFND